MKKLKFLPLILLCSFSLTVVSALAACSNNDNNNNGPSDTEGPETPNTPSYVADTTAYYAIGTGTGDLSASSWNMNYTELSFVKDATVTDANVYTLTMKMYAGDHFQIIHDASWNGQMGASYLSGAKGYGAYAYATFDADGALELFGGGDWGQDIEAAQGGVYTFTLTTYPGSTDLNTITYTRVVNYDMTVRGDMSSDAIKMTDIGGNWEYVLIVGETDLKRDAGGATGTEYAAVQVYNAAKSKAYYLEDGDYTAYEDSVYGYVNLLPEGAYYVTYSETSDEISITPTAHDIYVQGIKNSVNMTIGDGKWTATVTVVASDYAEGKEYAELNLYDRVSDDTLATLQLPAGTYAIKYTQAGGAEYEKLAYYLVGTFANAGWDISETSVELQATDRNGVYNATFMLADMTSSNSWLTEEGGTDSDGRTAISAFRVVYGSKLNGIAEWCDARNTFVYEVGEATVTFVKGDGIYVTIDTSKDGTEYVEDTNKYGLAGTINGWNTSFAESLTFEKDTTVTDANVYTLVVTLAADAEVKVVVHGTWDNAMGSDKVTDLGTDLADNDGNIKVVKAGKYTFTLTTYPNAPAQNTITYTWAEKTPDNDDDTYVEDTNKYGLAGTINGWSTEFADNLAFEKDETVTDANVYTLVVTLAADAEVKVVIHGTWDNAMGADKVTNLGTDLVNSDGNIKVVTAGKYTFTLTTNPNDTSKNTITYTVEPSTDSGEEEDGGEEATVVYGLAGTINGWSNQFADELKFDKDDTENVYTLTVTFAADDEFKVVIYGSWDNAIGADKVTDLGTDLVDNDGNIKVVTAGEYTFTLTIGENGSVALTYSLA